MKAFLILEDGTVFKGKAIGAKREVISEIVFNTSMAGYTEVFTDPSYAGQAVRRDEENKCDNKKCESRRRRRYRTSS